MEQLKKYVLLATQKKELAKQLENAKEELSKLEPDVLEYMQEKGVESIKLKIDGVKHLLYIKKDVRATFQGTDTAFELIQKYGLDDALKTTINPQRASSICREYLNDDDVERPAWLDEAFSIYEGFKAAVRKG